MLASLARRAASRTPASITFGRAAAGSHVSQCRCFSDGAAKCLCGACEVATKGAPKWVANCHSSQCRRALSSSYASLDGYATENVTITKGQDNLQAYTTGKEERFSCKTCSSKLFAHLHHLDHKAVYNDAFTTPNHGPDGAIHPDYKPSIHIFYTSGNTNIVDGLPKYADLPAAFGGSDEQVDEQYHK
jgi:hypothetical protein